MDHAYRAPWRLIVVMLFGLIALSGCAKTTGSGTASSATVTGRSSAVINKADQQISHQKITAARQTLDQATNPTAAVKSLATGLRYYQAAADSLADNQLSAAKGEFQTLNDYQGTSDAAFVTARRKLERQYQAVKLANGYYNTARDELSMHNLTSAKNNIDKLDAIGTVHPVIKKLQQKALAMKQAIMNYEASQSTSSGSDSSTVTSSSTTSSSSSATSSTTSSQTESSSSSSTATSSASSSASSSSDLSTAEVVKQFRAAVNTTFGDDTEFDVTKKTDDYYQINVVPASSNGSTAETTTYRFYPNSGQVTKQDRSGTFD